MEFEANEAHDFDQLISVNNERKPVLFFFSIKYLLLRKKHLIRSAMLSHVLANRRGGSPLNWGYATTPGRPCYKAAKDIKK